MTGALDGIRVLDLSRILAGPYCTQILADHGADVIKVERPGKGDDTRAFGPPFKDGESAYFLSINRNKRSMAIDMKSPDGIAIVKELIAVSDCLIENFRPGAMEKLGIGYDEASRINPRIIYCSISGFGASGPWKEKPGYDLAVQGMGGIMSITGDEDGIPTKVGTSIADITAGLYAAEGILLALFARERIGKGQFVDVSMLDGQVSLLTYQAGIHLMDGSIPTRKGNRHPTIAPYETFRASNGFFNLAVGNDRIWNKLVALLEPYTDDLTDPAFETNPRRVENRDRLFDILSGIFVQRTKEEWIEDLDAAGIPSGPILDIGEVLSHEQVVARDMVVETDHSGLGKIRLTGVPVKLSDTPGAVRSAPPVLGCHTREILSEVLDYDDGRIESLLSSGAVAGPES